MTDLGTEGGGYSFLRGTFQFANPPRERVMG